MRQLIEKKVKFLLKKKYERDGIIIKVFDKYLSVKHPEYKAKKYKIEKDLEQQLNNLFYYWGELERFNIPTLGRWGYLYD